MPVQAGRGVILCLREGEKMNEVLQTIKKRSSIRAYKAEKLTKEELDALIAAGLQAPTAANRQEIHFTVVDGDNPILSEVEEEKNAFRGLRPRFNFYYDAPTVIFISADTDFHWGTLDAGIAVENISLAAQSMGLGSLIIGCIYEALNGDRADYFREKLAIPDGYRFEIAIALGRRDTEKEPHEYDFDKNVTIL